MEKKREGKIKERVGREREQEEGEREESEGHIGWVKYNACTSHLKIASEG